MNQTSLFDTPAALAADVLAPRPGRTHADDPATSHAAARKIAVKAGTHRAIVLEALAAAPDGLTQEQLWLAGGGKFPCHAQTRAEELADDGLAERSGRTRTNSSGNEEQIWLATDLGRTVARTRT